MARAVHRDLVQGLKMVPRISFTRRNLPFARTMLRVLSGHTGGGRGVTIEKTVASGVRIRVYRPEATEPVGALLWIHGGGFIMGSPEQDDALCARFARELGILVVSPAYRLAPRHPFPAALDDCRASWMWTVRQLREPDAALPLVAVGGKSAGGGLAASLAQRIHDEGGLAPAAQLLVYPMLDDRTVTRLRGERRRYLLWDRRSNETGWTSYLGRDPGGSEVPPYAVPARRGDLSGLPPAWIGVGTLDMFYSESSDYARRLEAAGGSCRLLRVEGAFHGFDSVMPKRSVSEEFVAEEVDFLRRHLAIEPTDQSAD